MMSPSGPPPLQSISLRNVLSFGNGGEPIPLGSLNVLIGPNGSGKSNLIEAVALLRATPNDVRSVAQRGGGVGEWIWKGTSGEAATIDAVITYPSNSLPLRHTFAFRARNQAFAIEDERIENTEPLFGYTEPYFYYRYQRGNPAINIRDFGRRVIRDSIVDDQSILAQRRDPELYPELTHVADLYNTIRIYREWTFGRNTVFRMPQSADMRNDRLEEDFSNIGLFINRLCRTLQTKKALLSAFRDIYAGIDDL